MGSCDPRFQYIAKLGELEIDQVRISPLDTVYKILAIERSGYCICRCYGETKRVWGDVLLRWRLK